MPISPLAALSLSLSLYTHTHTRARTRTYSTNLNNHSQLRTRVCEKRLQTCYSNEDLSVCDCRDLTLVEFKRLV